MVKLIIIGPKEMVPFAKMLIKSHVASIQERHKFMDRQKEAKDALYGGYDQGGDYNQQPQHWDQYGQQPPMPMNNGQGQGGRSMRRQRKQYQGQQQTERSMKDTQDFNYLNADNRNKRRQRQERQQQRNGNDDAHYPSLGRKEQNNVNGNGNA